MEYIAAHKSLEDAIMFSHIYVPAIPGRPFVGCAVHTCPAWWSFMTEGGGDCAGSV